MVRPKALLDSLREKAAAGRSPGVRVVQTSYVRVEVENRISLEEDTILCLV